VKLLSAVLFLVAALGANAQDVDPLGSGLPASHTLSSLPKSLVAIQPQLAGDGVGSLLSMSFSMSMGSGSGQDKAGINPFLVREMSQTLWVDAEELKHETTAMLKGYKLSYSMYEPYQPMTSEMLMFRLQYVRRESMVAFTVRPDLDPENLRTAITAPAPKIMSPAQEAAKRTSALSNVKQVSTAMMILLSDTDDIFPYVQSTAQMFELTMPYMKNNELTKSMNPNGGRLLFNISLAGVSSVDLESPQDIPMVYDEKPWPDGRWLVGFADSHAKYLTQAEWDALAKNLKLKLKKHGKPLKPGQSPPVIK
jgi:hypothetical protein